MHPFEKKVQTFIAEQALFLPHHHLLLAVSGGIDSMVMLHCLQSLGYVCRVAHCNFNLRGAAAAADQHFVQQAAQAAVIPFYSQSFDTLAYAKQHKISTQVAARELRYKWFATLLTTISADYLLTAHHLDDAIETFLYNFAKGTGLKGLLGIPTVNNRTLRPLLGVSRAEIEHYAKEKNILFREDASNAKLDYRRNLIRHKILPVLQQINPALTETSAQTFSNLQQQYIVYEYAIANWRKGVFLRDKADHVIIDAVQLASAPAPDTLLFEWLKPFEFTATQIRQLLHASTQVGSRFLSPTHVLVKERTTYEIFPLREITHPTYVWNIAAKAVLETEEFLLRVASVANLPTTFATETAYFDADTLTPLLYVRRAQQGDFFRPFGMRGKKQLLSDYFINHKFSNSEKSNTFVLVNEHGDICWLIGHRSDERVRVTAATRRIVKIEYQSKKYNRL